MFTFVEDKECEEAFDFLSNEDTKRLWSSVFDLKDQIAGHNIESIRKKLFERIGLTFLISKQKSINYSLWTIVSTLTAMIFSYYRIATKMNLETVG